MEGTHRFPCEQCGAFLAFKPSSQRLKCDFCGHEQLIPASPWDGKEHGLLAALRDAENTLVLQETQEIQCRTCAASFTLAGEQGSGTCPYCGTPFVEAQAERHARQQPDALLPMAVNQRQAREAVRAWMGRLWFAPASFKQLVQREEALTGLYVPHWTFDSDTFSRYRGQRGTRYTVTRTVNGKTQTQTRIRWRNVSGTVRVAFDDLTLLASKSLSQDIADRLGPWPLDQLLTPEPGHLAGFSAEHLQVGLHESYSRAQERMETRIRQAVRRDIGGDAQRIDGLDTDYSNQTFKLILLPIWTAAVQWKGRVFPVAVNGVTGEVAGRRPWTRWQLALIGLGLAALVVLLILLAEGSGPL